MRVTEKGGRPLVTMTPPELDKPICREQRMMFNTLACTVEEILKSMMVLNTLVVIVEADIYIYDGVEHPGIEVGADTYIYDGV